VHGRHRAAEGVAPDDSARALALVDALDHIGAAPDPDETLRRIAAVARVITGATYALAELAGGDAPGRRALHGRLVDGRHERLHADLRRGGRLVGRIVIGRGAEGFAPEDRDVLERLAGLSTPLVLAAVACQDGEQWREALLVADRDRIARDLHDLVIQRLYATGLQLQAARRADGAAMIAALTTGVRAIDTAIRDLRATVFELNHGRRRSLAGEVRAMVEEYAATLGFRPALRISGPVDTALTEAVADEVLLVLREALSNIVRHAGASTAQVDLTASAAWFMLRVADDGVGMPTGASVSSGLRNARRRAEALGGVMRTGSVTPHGASVVWLVPASR
jgi:signal transduction histidine kinase